MTTRNANTLAEQTPTAGARGLSSAADTAYLSNVGRYTIFRFRDQRLKFIGPWSLERYHAVTHWDHGYIVVMTKYAHSPDDIEEYIDLRPILDELCMDQEAFLAPIRKVEVRYD